MTKMEISEKGIGLIKQFEGCKLYAYRDAVGVPTIGYGRTKGVYMGMAITQAQADKFLVEDMSECFKVLNKLGVNFAQRQFDALCSWIYNLGQGNFNSSTLRKRIVADASDEAIADEIVKWVYAGGKVLLGLQRRRVAEANMFLGRTRYAVKNGAIVKV